MREDFGEQVKKWVTKAEKRYRATTKTAVKNVVNDAQTPKGKGGNMPVITSFLRGSLVAAVGEMPSGATKPNKGDESTPANETQEGSGFAYALALWEPNAEEVFYVGWSAAYARRIEYGFDGTDSLGRKYKQQGSGFLRLATQNWDEHVKKAARKAVRTIK